MSTMKAVVFKGTNHIAVEEVPKPLPKAGLRPFRRDMDRVPQLAGAARSTLSASRRRM